MKEEEWEGGSRWKRGYSISLKPETIFQTCLMDAILVIYALFQTLSFLFLPVKSQTISSVLWTGGGLPWRRLKGSIAHFNCILGQLVQQLEIHPVHLFFLAQGTIHYLHTLSCGSASFQRSNTCDAFVFIHHTYQLLNKQWALIKDPSNVKIICRIILMYMERSE